MSHSPESPLHEEQEVGVAAPIESAEQHSEETQTPEVMRLRADMEAALARQEILTSFHQEHHREWDAESADDVDQKTGSVLQAIESTDAELASAIDQYDTEVNGEDRLRQGIELAQFEGQEIDAEEAIIEKEEGIINHQKVSGFRKFAQLATLFVAGVTAPMAAQAGVLRDVGKDVVIGSVEDSAEIANAQNRAAAAAASAAQYEQAAYKRNLERTERANDRSFKRLQEKWEEKELKLKHEIEMATKDLQTAMDAYTRSRAQADLVMYSKELRDLSFEKELALKKFASRAADREANVQESHQERMEDIKDHHAQTVADAKRGVQVARQEHNNRVTVGIYKEGIEKVFKKD